MKFLTPYVLRKLATEYVIVFSIFEVVVYSLIVVPTLSQVDQHVLAVLVKCDENYTKLDKTFEPLFNEINDLNTTGRIEISDQAFDVVLFTGGDNQLLRSISNNACSLY